MSRIMRWAGQALCYALFALALAVFSRQPRYEHLDAHQALLKLSFSHPGQLKSECRRRGDDELARLPANMRNPLDCPRERSAVSVEMSLDGVQLVQRTVPPSGLSRDGPSTLYARQVIPSGPHQLEVRFKDSERTPGYTHQRSLRIDPVPGQVLVVDFNAQQGGIVIQ